jgi:hypothetical protein
MPSFQKILGAVAGLVALASALPALDANTMRAYGVSKRQANAAAAANLSDTDILQL